MNTYISIFPNTHPNISGSICIAAGNINADTKELAIMAAANCVPYQWPFLVYEQVHYDKPFHEAYEPDWSNADGYGLNTNMQLNFVAQGFLENW